MGYFDIKTNVAGEVAVEHCWSAEFHMTMVVHCFVPSSNPHVWVNKEQWGRPSGKGPLPWWKDAMRTKVVACEDATQVDIVLGSAEIEMTSLATFEVCAKSPDGKTHCIRRTDSMLDAWEVWRAINSSGLYCAGGRKERAPRG